jgi:hypothetical protein
LRLLAHRQLSLLLTMNSPPLTIQLLLQQLLQALVALKAIWLKLDVHSTKWRVTRVSLIQAAARGLLNQRILHRQSNSTGEQHLSLLLLQMETSQLQHQAVNRLSGAMRERAKMREASQRRRY